MHFLYLDPGSGNYIIQALIAVALGGAYFFKDIWFRIKMLFTKRQDKDILEDE